MGGWVGWSVVECGGVWGDGLEGVSEGMSIDL